MRCDKRRPRLRAPAISMPSTSILMKSTRPVDEVVERHDAAPRPPDRARNAWRRGPPVTDGIGAEPSPLPRRPRSRAATDRHWRARSPRPRARIAAAARGCGSIGMTRSACIDRGEEQRVVAGIGADIDDAQAARQPVGQEAQLLLLEEQAAHLLALDHRVEPGIGEAAAAARRSCTAHEDRLALEMLDEPRAVGFGERRQRRRGRCVRHCAVL